MGTAKIQYRLIAILFVATNLLYYFAQRDTRVLSEKPLPLQQQAPVSAIADTLLHYPAGSQ
jgi:hypothetical protein